MIKKIIKINSLFPPTDLNPGKNPANPALETTFCRKKIDERKCQVVELRLFGGLTVEETSTALDLSRATMKRDWKFARAWLYREIYGPGAES
ncbi:MAG: ECF-type sigma factor [Acidobacteriota bacterium]